MPKEIEVLEIEQPHFTVRVSQSMLRIDLKGALKEEIEDALESKPILRETLGKILGIFVPLHVRLSDVDSVSIDKKGDVVIKLPRHRDVTIPFNPKHAKKLVDKLNQLIPIEKEKEIARIMREQKLQRIEKTEKGFEKEKAMSPIGGAQFPVPPPRGMREEEKEAADEQER